MTVISYSAGTLFFGQFFDTQGLPLTEAHAILQMEWQPEKKDSSILLAELDVGPSGESIFNIRPELSRKTLNNDTWLANIQPDTVQNSATGSLEQEKTSFMTTPNRFFHLKNIHGFRLTRLDLKFRKQISTIELILYGML